MYIKSICIEGYAPIEELKIDFLNEEGIAVPTLLFGLHGTGKSFILNKLSQVLKKWHKQFYNETASESTIGINEQKVECYYDSLINIKYGYLCIAMDFTKDNENISQHEDFTVVAINKNENIPQYKEAYRRREAKFPKNIESIFEQEMYSGRENKLLFSVNRFYVGSLEETEVRERLRAQHEKKIYMYFPSTRMIHSPWSYLDKDSVFSPHYPMQGRSETKIIQDDFYGEIVAWLQHVLFQKYCMQASGAAGDSTELVDVSLNYLENLLQTLLQEKFPNYEVSLFFDSRHRRVFIRLFHENKKLPHLIPLESLSETELMLFSIMALILKKCEESQIIPEKLEGMILIDNAEQGLDFSAQMLHLPTIIRTFPGIQFILSTSSICLLKGMKKHFEQNFNLVELTKLETISYRDEVNEEVLSSTAKEKIIEMSDDSFKIISSLKLSDENMRVDLQPLKAISSIKKGEHNDPYLKGIELTFKGDIFPEGLSWKGITKFSVIAGKNGIGKTQFLRLVANDLRQLFPAYAMGPRRDQAVFDFSSTVSGSRIQVLYYGCSSGFNVEPDQDRRFTDFLRAVSEKAAKYLNLYEVSIHDKSSYDNMINRFEETERSEYFETLKLFDQKKQLLIKASDFTRDDGYIQDLKTLFARCVSKVSGVPIFLACYIEVFIGYLIKLMFPGELDALNRFLEEAEFKYKVKENDQNYRIRHDYKSSFILTNGDQKIFFDVLSPGEKLELMTLVWLFEANLMHRGQPAILLLDEIDAHLHPSLTYDIIERIKNHLVDRYDVQVIMTTHNPVTVNLLKNTDNLFLMTDENPKKEKQIIKVITKKEIHRQLAPYSVCINSAIKFVFVEADDDVKFYELIYRKILKLEGNDFVAPLFFKAHGQKKSVANETKRSQEKRGKKEESFPTEEQGDNSNRGLVVRLVQKCVPEMEGEVTLKDFIYGIVDGDNQNNDNLPKNVMTLQRYSLENYMCDPLHVIYFLIEVNSKDRNFEDGNFSDLKKRILKALKEEHDINELPTTFQTFRSFGVGKQEKIAQVILDELAQFLFEKILNDYKYLIDIMKKERFKLASENGDILKKKECVQFVDKIKLNYHAFFLYMQGHYLEGLYKDVFRGFPGKKDLFGFLEEKNILIPKELHTIFITISNEANISIEKQKEHLQQIQSREDELASLPSIKKENAKRVKVMSEQEESIKKYKAEIKKLKGEKNELLKRCEDSEECIAKLPETFFSDGGYIPPYVELQSKVTFFKKQCKLLHQRRNEKDEFSTRYANVKEAYEQAFDAIKRVPKKLEDEANKKLEEMNQSCESLLGKGILSEKSSELVFWK